MPTKVHFTRQPRVWMSKTITPTVFYRSLTWTAWKSSIAEPLTGMLLSAEQIAVMIGLKNRDFTHRPARTESLYVGVLSVIA